MLTHAPAATVARRAPLSRQSVPSASSAAASLGEDATKRGCACGGGCPRCSGAAVQTKLLVGHTDDPAEREADAIAAEVTQAPAGPAKAGADARAPVVRRKVAGAGRGTPLGRRAAAGIAAATRGGEPLPDGVRAAMEPRFGTDFAEVRIHRGAEAAASAAAIGARAYTLGRDVVFGDGQYDPGSHDGRRLLAHELAHVVQQRGSSTGVIARDASLSEKWGALWGAGPVDSYRANKLAKEALAAARQTGLPGIHNGHADAWRHCYWNCRMTEVIGEEDAADIAENHEEHGGNDIAERMMDTWNNEEGRSCSGECGACCQDKLDSGKLWILYSGKVGRSTPAKPTAAPTAEKYDKY